METVIHRDTLVDDPRMVEPPSCTTPQVAIGVDHGLGEGECSITLFFERASAPYRRQRDDVIGRLIDEREAQVRRAFPRGRRR